MRVAQMKKIPNYEQKYHKVKRLFYDAQEILLIHLRPLHGIKGPRLSIFLHFSTSLSLLLVGLQGIIIL